MSSAYPIVNQLKLTEPERRGKFKLLGQRRENSEIPALKPHEVLVYRVDGSFKVDDGRKGLGDDDVIRATSVSVVDMRRDAGVGTQFEIDSEDASQFTVNVNFVCTVTDAVRVVRDGQANASDALLSYLRGYQRLFELGLEHQISDINTLRRELGHHIKAYLTIKPPEIAGLSVALANVQVRTPGEVAAHEKELRDRRHEHVIAEFGVDSEISIEQRRLAAQSELGTSRINNAKSTADAIGKDPYLALILAYGGGEMTASELAAAIQARQDEEQRRAREEAREREEQERLRLTEALRVDAEILREFNKNGHFADASIDPHAWLRRLSGHLEALTGAGDIKPDKRAAIEAAADGEDAAADGENQADEPSELKEEDGD